jgi:hypothetical protein
MMMASRLNKTLQIPIAVGKGVSEKIEQHNIEWGKLVSQLSKSSIDSTISHEDYSQLPRKDRIPHKSRRGFYLLGEVESGARNNQNIARRSGLMIDVEGGNAGIDEIKTVLKDWELIIHSTRSYRDDDKRFRVVVPLREPITVPYYKSLAQYLCDMLEVFGIVVDRGTSTRSAQIAFYPTASADQPFIFEHNEGRLLSLEDLPADYTPAERSDDVTREVDLRPKENISVEEIATALSYLKDESDDRNTWIEFGMALYHQFDGTGEGLELWDQWSRYSDKYPGLADIEKRWSGFHVANYKTKTVRSILSAARSNGWRQTRVEIGELETPKDMLAAARIGDMLRTKAPPVEWIIPDLIPANKVGSVVAQGGTGKSFAFLQIAFSIATGYTLFGHWVMQGEPGKVLILAAEDDRDDIHRRIYALGESIEVIFPGDEERKQRYIELAHENMFVASRVGKDNLLTAIVDGAAIKTRLADQLADFCNEIDDLRLIMLDPASRFRGGDENKQEDATRFVETLEYIRCKVGCSLLFSHHTSKTGDRNSQHASRGASALTDAVRWQANMSTMALDEASSYNLTASDAPHYVRFNITKTNYTAPYEGVWLHRETGGILKYVDIREDEQLGRGVTKQTAKGRIIEIVERRELHGDLVSVRQLKTEYAGMDNDLGVSKDQVRSLVDELLEEGKLEQINGGRGGGKVLRKVAK